jgi:hypothetical protein
MRKAAINSLAKHMLYKSNTLMIIPDMVASEKKINTKKIVALIQ